MSPKISPQADTTAEFGPSLTGLLSARERTIHVESLESTVVLKMNIDRIDNTPEAALQFLTDFRDTLEHLEQTPKRVVLSLENVGYLGLRGVGALLEIHHGAQPHHRRFPPFAIADLQSQPRDKLHTTRLDTLIPTFDTVAEAVADLSWPKAS